MRPERSGTGNANVYEIRPRKDHRALIWFLVRCHSVACGTANQTPSRMHTVIASPVKRLSHSNHARVMNKAEEKDKRYARRM
jgi:hypothetical protein